MLHAGRLDGRTCLIVGGTGGIGLSSARRFLEEGARVVVAGRPPENGWPVLDELRRLGLVWEIDIELSDGEASVARLFEYTVEILAGRLDVLLHVAGISGRKFGDGALHECSSEAWMRVMQVNAQGAFHTNREAVRTMRKQPLDAWGLRGTVRDVAEGALYLCEPASRFVTGAELTVDGGWCVSEGQSQDGE